MAVGCGQNLMLYYIQIDTQQGNFSLQQQISVPQSFAIKQVSQLQPFENMQMILIDSNNKIYFATINSDKTVTTKRYAYDYSSYTYFDSFAQVFLAAYQNQIRAYFSDSNMAEDFNLSDSTLQIVNLTVFEGNQSVFLTYLYKQNVQFAEYQLTNKIAWRQCSSPNCAICQQNNQNLCQLCTKDLFRSIQSDQCQCIPQYFNNPSIAQCQQCSKQCATCADTAENCTSCSKQSFRQLSGTKCVCLQGYYENDQLECVFCDQTKNFIFINNQCQCKDGYYMDADGNCQQCDISCKTCQNQANQCTSCKDGINRIFSPPIKQCLCVAQYFSLPNQEICQLCDPKQNKMLMLGNCICIDGYYMNNESCVKCPFGCTQCENNDNCYNCDSNMNVIKQDTKCVCKLGYSLQNGKCEVCPIYCQDCLNSQCTKCLPNLNRQLVNNKCACLSGYFENSLQQCILCDQTKNFILINGVCQCKDGYYADPNNNCQPCSASCQTCQDNQNKCTKCKDGLNRVLNPATYTCDCKSQYFSLTNEGICQLCDPTQQKILINNQCICQDGYYIDDQTQLCQQCPLGCLQCKNKDTCILCDQRQNRESYKQTCVCMKGFYEKDKQCVQCNDQIAECQASKLCNQIANRRLVNNECICIEQYFTDFNNKTGTCLPCNQLYNRVFQNGQCQCIQGYQEVHQNSCQQMKLSYFQLISSSCNELKINFEDSLESGIIIQDCIQITIDRLSDETWTIEHPLSQFDVQFQIISSAQIDININPNVGIEQDCNVSIDLSNCNIPNLKSYSNCQEVQLKAKLKGNDQTATQVITSITETGSKIAVSSILPLFISGNFQFLASLLDICQLIYAMIFINIELPLNLKLFYDAIQEFNIPFTNFFDKMEHFDEIHNESPKKFSEEDRQGFYLANFGDNLSLLILIILVDLLMNLFSRFLPIQKLRKLIKTARTNLFNAKLYLDILWGLYIELCIAVFLQLQSIEYADYFLEGLSYLFTFVSIVFIVFPYYICYQIKIGKQNYFTEILTENLNFQYYNILLYLRKFFLILVVTVLYDYPLIQIVFFMVWNLIQLVITVKFKPYKSKLDNYKHMIQTLFFFSSTMLITILFKSYEQSNEESRINLCWFIIANLIIIILADFLSFVHESCTALLMYFTKIRAKIKEFKSKSNKVVPNDILIDMDKIKQYSQSSQQDQIKSISVVDQQKLQNIISKKILNFQEISISNQPKSIQLLQEKEQDFLDIETNRIDIVAQSKVYSNQELVSIQQINCNKSIYQNDNMSVNQNSNRLNQISSWNDLSSPQVLIKQGSQNGMFGNFEMKNNESTNIIRIQRKKQSKYSNRKQSQLTAASDKYDKQAISNNISNSNLFDSHKQNEQQSSKEINKKPSSQNSQKKKKLPKSNKK
ncbi:bowman-birk serine protease inhibitor family protein (macronuclear) [Tetrahymena thermophila SB210]|uniref:Bowman-birk serine protease inhibitor family protein n=1 Tax=Tetrahymena thermophila (strain SB210) TaxID=312017 RepID=I7LT19_TETTS|nr:bowman-birk serine protease inhibitor family protein [Tetrahymena thermophila SB210]EAR84085.2 bowman-birk serine protease inhibitor family protein [Tetrahymena thermophila SB210]|eukprot:XP_001031748.2 bowman-birk serine protease inhibitor family protein [Tetrahymena thermophila SB210]